MSILICVIIALVAINVVLAYYVINMHFFMKNRVNSIIRNSETLINISKDLKECAGKVNSEPQNINSSSTIEDKFFTASNFSKFFTSILSYVRDINVCVVFFTATMTVDLFLSAYLNDILPDVFKTIIFCAVGIIALIPSAILYAKLVLYGWTNISGILKTIAFIVILSFVFFILVVFISYSLFTIKPIVIDLLKSIGFFNNSKLFCFLLPQPIK